MAPLSSPDSSHARFDSTRFCSSAMASSPYASGFGFQTVGHHLQRLLQSSASTNEEDSFKIQQQARQFYLQQRQEHTLLSNGSTAADVRRASKETMPAELPKETSQLGQALQSYVPGGTNTATVLPGLMRNHSAPSSVLSSLSGIGNAIMNSNTELAHFLSGNAPSDLQGRLKSMDASHASLHADNHGMTIPSADRLSGHSNGLVPPCRTPLRRVCGGELLSQMAMADADGVALMRTANRLSEVSRTAPSSYCQRSPFMHGNTYLNNGNGAAQKIPIAKDGLLRHSSSPAGFLSQLNEDQERQRLASSSGNSSEEGSNERHGGRSFMGNFTWDESRNMTAGGSSNLSIAVRKRIRDSGEKGYTTGSAFFDAQKADVLEPSVVSNYLGHPASSSPENNTNFIDSIPCRTRAKRGCATHPRSIAERVRRTKISERMKKLQELVPNMDKQANIAEMLDEAVDYVKCLQQKVQDLTEHRAKCKCTCGKPQEAPK